MAPLNVGTRAANLRHGTPEFCHVNAYLWARVPKNSGGPSTPEIGPPECHARIRMAFRPFLGDSSRTSQDGFRKQTGCSWSRYQLVIQATEGMQ